MNELTDWCIEKVDEAKERIAKNPKDLEEASVLEKLIMKNGPDSAIPIIMAIDTIVAGIDSTGSTSGFFFHSIAK